ncbi:MAG TPA: glycine zipper family protein [Stellaceae bacterium]|nr:glycine zipper family protein [Stellaceae bacterium]
MSRFLILSLITLTSIGITRAAGTPALANPLYAQYYPSPPTYGYPPSSSPPPCQAVTPGPFQGAARGAAGGALIGAISGNAGRGAAIGAGFGAVRSAARRGSARSAGACY